MPDRISSPCDCPGCGTYFDQVVGVSHGFAPEPDSIFVCPCGCISTYTRQPDSSLLLVALTQADYDALTSSEKRDIRFAVRAIRDTYELNKAIKPNRKPIDLN